MKGKTDLNTLRIHFKVALLCITETKIDIQSDAQPV